MVAPYSARGTRWLVPLSLLSLVLGGLLGVEARTWRRYDPTEWLRGRAGQEFYARRTEVEQQRATIDRLRQQVARVERKAARSLPSRKIGAALEQAQAGLGLVPMEGPGIAVALDDGPTPPEYQGWPVELCPNLVSDWQLLLVVNELWAAGAEAISLNGQRIGTGTAIVHSGPLVQVNHQAVGGPFVLVAIGNPEVLAARLALRHGLAEALREYGVKVTLTRQGSVRVPALAVAPRFKGARPTAS